MPRTSDTCPAFCANPHREQPGDLVHHHTDTISIPAVDGQALPLVAGYHAHDGVPRLDVGPYQLNLPAARQLLAELQIKVALLERLNVDATLDAILDRYQVA